MALSGAIVAAGSTLIARRLSAFRLRNRPTGPGAETRHGVSFDPRGGRTRTRARCRVRARSASYVDIERFLARNGHARDDG